MEKRKEKSRVTNQFCTVNRKCRLAKKNYQTLEVMEEDKSEFRSAGGLHLGTESIFNVVASLPTVAAINWAALNGGTEEKFLCRKGQKTSFTKGRKYLH